MRGDIILYTLPGCPFCQKVKDKLSQKRLAYKEIIIDRDNKPKEVTSTGGMVPVIKIGDLVMSESSKICAYIDENL